MLKNQLHQPNQTLIASPELGFATALARALTTGSHRPDICHDAKGVLRVAGRTEFDIVVLDLELGEQAGMDLVSYIRRRSPRTRIILLFEIAKLERALDGIRQGAYFYLPRTCMPSDVALVVHKAIKSIAHESAAHSYEHSVFEEMAGGSPAMKRVIEVISKVAPTDSTVLLLGESGTGKELLANTIHRLSPRRDMPFIAINCAALPEQLLESEMFGHVKGSFTGADSDKRGLFEEADGGTIFLDEIGDMALVTQAKLLRVLQNGEIRAVGSAKPKRVDVRVIAATNRDLERAVENLSFREDLYFRLNVIQVRIPPLRERLETLPGLVDHFVNRANTQFNKNIVGLDERAQALLRNYTYPGNVRELESIVAHAVIMADANVIRAEDLPDTVRNGVRPRLALPNLSAESISSINEMEAQAIRAALDRLNGNQTEAAKRLGVSRSTLWRKMKEYGIPAG
ncbi:MAG: sigma-54-dependent Fis family transcriptional regulator [Candidatus Hydrogenedentes bacterium]|nr:sigma-54-dependent Fis family transcriptional regulator [Candidatus Hydrogenedentota bacterium]